MPARRPHKGDISISSGVVGNSRSLAGMTELGTRCVGQNGYAQQIRPITGPRLSLVNPPTAMFSTAKRTKEKASEVSQRKRLFFAFEAIGKPSVTWHDIAFHARQHIDARRRSARQHVQVEKWALLLRYLGEIIRAVLLTRQTAETRTGLTLGLRDPAKSRGRESGGVDSSGGESISPRSMNS